MDWRSISWSIPVAAFCLASPVWATDLTIAGIYNLAREQGSVAKTIAHFPDQLKNNHVHVFAPVGSLGGSFLDPRTITFSDDARLVVSFNGSPEQVGYNTLKVRQFLDDEARFDYRSIDFNNGQVILSERNPPGCMGCHDPSQGVRGGPDPIPLWNKYNVWSDCYGSGDDYLQEGTSQAISFAAFKKHAQTHERYSQLNWGTYPNYPYREGRLTDQLNTRPNARYTILLSKLNAIRLARIITQENLGYPFLHRLYGQVPVQLNRFGIRDSEVNLYRRRGNQLPLQPIEEGLEDAYWEGHEATLDRTFTEVVRRLAKDDPELVPYLRQAEEAAQESALRHTGNALLFDNPHLVKTSYNEITFSDFIEKRYSSFCKNKSCVCVSIN